MSDQPAPPIQLSTSLRTFSADDPGGWDELLETARRLDAAGFDRLVVSDHVVFGENLEAYSRPEVGGQRGGRQPTGPDGHWLEPLTVLSVLAGLTTRVRLGTGILLAALRRPVVLAKSAATLDVLSGGRLDLGVGVGWQREEYEAAGLDFGRRGRLLDHALEVCQTLWRERVAHHRSEELSFGPVHMMPKPLQAGGVPIWVSGTINSRVARRLARFGAGWIPWGPDGADPADSIPRMKRAVAEAGGDPTGLQVVATLRAVRTAGGDLDAERTMEAVPALAATGATDLRMWLGPADTTPDALSAIVAGFRAARDSARPAGPAGR